MALSLFTYGHYARLRKLLFGVKPSRDRVTIAAAPDQGLYKRGLGPRATSVGLHAACKSWRSLCLLDTFATAEAIFS
jgi:hypothetical protein